MIDSNTKLDSKEGIEHLVKWAIAHNIVLNTVHEKLAQKYGVPTDGLLVSRLNLNL